MSLDAQGAFLFPDPDDAPAPTPAESEPKASGGRPSFYILDAYSLIFQVYHAIPEMIGPAGQPTQAVFGIFRDLLNLVRSASPTTWPPPSTARGRSSARRSTPSTRRTGPRCRSTWSRRYR